MKKLLYVLAMAQLCMSVFVLLVGMVLSVNSLPFAAYFALTSLATSTAGRNLD